jgi:hypothetical protein
MHVHAVELKCYAMELHCPIDASPFPHSRTTALTTRTILLECAQPLPNRTPRGLVVCTYSLPTAFCPFD